MYLVRAHHSPLASTLSAERYGSFLKCMHTLNVEDDVIMSHGQEKKEDNNIRKIKFKCTKVYGYNV